MDLQEFLEGKSKNPCYSVFEIPHVLFAFEFESERPNGKLGVKTVSELPFVRFG